CTLSRQTATAHDYW
nr:immunoglobulin heavy chain junction region [Macaca mulatta]MOV56533.1 immunoglobulin heavy chain junction region [Macaca mulatta]MOV57964.1 immunoglobulin heavy chain junction region [Macaca mulatta]MOV58280.1 immunoglobulin heavy chain junction region [Macaca mulatta]MOV58316.1 immunoglobulin heavy chain junction region [Macaca mulatta]